MTHSEKEIIEGYLIHAKGDESYFWAFVEMLEILEKDTKRAWSMTCEMVRLAKDDTELEAIAAGPLEDILSFHGEEYIDQVEQLARKNAKFRQALGEVMIEEEDINPEFFARLQKVLVE